MILLFSRRLLAKSLRTEKILRKIFCFISLRVGLKMHDIEIIFGTKSWQRNSEIVAKTTVSAPVF